MLLTEEEAKKKMCGLGNANPAPAIGIRCFASDCMMWRWEEQPYLGVKTTVHESAVKHWEINMRFTKGEPAPEKGEGWFWMIPPEHKKTKGHCGLAGKAGGAS